MPHVSLPDGGSLFFTDDGAGPAVLFVHGWACDGSDGAWLQEDLVRDHRVVTVDLRGHGRSPGPAVSPEEMASDLAHLMRGLGLGPALVVGHSMGAIVSSVLAAEHPGAVAALVLIDPVFIADDSPLIPTLDALRPGSPVDPHEFARRVWRGFATTRTPRWLPVWHRRRVLGTDADVVRDAFLGLYDGRSGAGRRRTAQSRLRTIAAPVLAVYADQGAEVAEWHRSVVADDGPGNAHVIDVWRGHGHFLHQEDPERFAAQLRAWLGPIEPVAGPAAPADTPTSARE